MNTLWTTFLFFGLAVLGCHAPIGWVKWIKGGVVKNKDQWTKFWETTDYFYLGLAALSLIPASNEAWRFLSGVQLEQVFARLSGLEHIARDAHIKLSHYERLPLEVQSEDVISVLKKAVEVLDQGDPLLYEARELIHSRWGKKADEKIKTVNDMNEKIKAAVQTYDKFLSIGPIHDPKTHYSEDIKYLRDFIERKRNYANDLLTSSIDVGKGEGELMLLVLAPYLLGLGLAIRVAKVTAKLVTVVEEPQPN